MPSRSSVASNDDSFSSTDSFIEFTFKASGRYVIEVGSCCIGPVPPGADYLLHVSIENHPTENVDIHDNVELPVGGSVTYTATGTVALSATGTLVNTATVAVPAGVMDPDAANNSATDTDTLATRADLAITKDDAQAVAFPEQGLTYTLTVTNHGPADVTGAAVLDAFPAELPDCTWTCSPSSGSSCTASGAGDVDDLVDLPSGGTAAYRATCTVSPSAAGTLVNTATVAVPGDVFDPDPSNNSATDADALPADLAITKDDFQLDAVPGQPVSYTITVTNAGPGDAIEATVEDVFPAELLGVIWSCAPIGGASCTPASISLVDDREPNDTFATAQDLDPSDWHLSFDPNIGDKNANTSTTIPHVTIAGTGDDTVDLFSFTVADAGDRGIFDVDFGRGGDGPIDSYLRLYDGAETLVAANDDSFTTDGGDGSTSTQDSYLEYVFTAPGRHVVEVGQCCVTAIPGGGDYLLQVSLEHHPTVSVDLHDTVEVPVDGTLTYTATGTIDPAAAGTLVNRATVAAPGDPDTLIYSWGGGHHRGSGHSPLGLPLPP